ncbi:MAG: hypothetical protein ACRDJP_14190, partial [Actinomycetota bacterium]
VLDGVNLSAATLVGARGLDDERLAEALGIDAESLAGTLIEEDVRLEDRPDVLDALGPACGGRGVAGTSAYPAGDFHPMVILSTSGQVGLDTDRALDLGWEPMAVRFAQLVACVGDQDPVEIEICPYGGGGLFGTITRVRHERDVKVVEAATGRTVFQRSYEGTLPDPCPAQHVFLESNTAETFSGSDITFRDIEPDLARLVE